MKPIGSATIVVDADPLLTDGSEGALEGAGIAVPAHAGSEGVVAGLPPVRPRWPARRAKLRRDAVPSGGQKGSGEDGGDGELHVELNGVGSGKLTGFYQELACTGLGDRDSGRGKKC